MKRAVQRRLIRVIVLVAVCLLLVDAFFVAAEVMNRLNGTRGWFAWFAHSGWDGDPDGSFAERWGYTKATITGLLLLYLAVLYRRSAVLIATAVLFFVVALDDSLRFHEIGGGKLTRAWGIPYMFGVRGQDIGEILVWAAIGVPLMAWVLIAYFASNPRPRQIVRRLIPAFAGLLFFAVFIDVFTIFAAFQWDWTGRIYYLMGLLEMAGELAGLTAVLLVPLWFVVRHHLHGRRIDAAADPHLLRRPLRDSEPGINRLHPRHGAGEPTPAAGSDEHDHAHQHEQGVEGAGLGQQQLPPTHAAQVVRS